MKKEISQHFRDLSCIYALKKNKEIVYIGTTGNLYTRLLEHIKNGKDFDDVSAVLMSKGKSSRLEIQIIEQCIISEFKPKLNKMMAKNSFEYLSLIPHECFVIIGQTKNHIDAFKWNAEQAYECLKTFDYENDTVKRAERVKND